MAVIPRFPFVLVAALLPGQGLVSQSVPSQEPREASHATSRLDRFLSFVGSARQDPDRWSTSVEQALRVKPTDSTAERVFAARCLGAPKVHRVEALLGMLRDESVAVRTAARRGLRAASLSPAQMRAFRRSLLHELRQEPDAETRSRIEALRRVLIARLRPAKPGGTRVASSRIATPRKNVGPRARAPKRLRANEFAAIATLRNLSSAQAQLQAAGIIDVSANARGEYGYFAELSGAVGVRADEVGKARSERRVMPPVLSGAFGKIDAKGRVSRSGYHFRLFLPGVDAAPSGELSPGKPPAPVTAKHAEVHWCAFAWPIEYGVSGRRAFFVCETGDVYACANVFGDYSGDSAPLPDAARTTIEAQRSSMRDPAPKHLQPILCRDGQRWSVAR